MRQLNSHDLVGISWRPELAAGILSHLSEINVLEIMAEDYFFASKAARLSLKLLAAQVPIVLHGLSMGLASSKPVEIDRLERMASLVNEVQPLFWSEHLAFVRGGGREIGHLAAPPRTEASVEGTIKNVLLATRIVGSKPLLENIATLMDPPASAMDEAQWVSQILELTGCELLLDLHNLYANALNFGTPPELLLSRFPAQKVRAVHLSGGHWIKESDPFKKRLLDDHKHDVPDPVFTLLTLLARATPNPLTVLLERDGKFPPFPALVEQLQKARQCLKMGRREAA